MNQLYNIPMGFRFQPSDEELIKAFLIPKVKGFPLQWNGIVEKELYGADASPWDVFRDIDDDNSPSLYCNTKSEGTTTKKTLYVFTKVMKAALNAKKRVFRSAGGGTWSGQTGSKCITDSTTGDIIGFTKMFSFKHKGGDEVFGHWIMHEYSLSAEWSNDFVLCRITRCMKDSVRRPTQLSSPVMVEESELERDCKKQKCVVDEGFNSENCMDILIYDYDDAQTSNHEVEGCTLTAEDYYAAYERAFMHADDAEKSNHEVEDILIHDENCTLTVEDIDRMLMEDDDEEVEGCTLTVEDIDRMLMEDDDEEVEGCTLTAEEHYAAFERVLMHSDDAVKSNNEIEPS